MDVLRSGAVAAKAAQIADITSRTEAAYASAGLPEKNVTDRVGKQLRLMIYNSDVADADVAKALTVVLAAGPSPIVRAALEAIAAELKHG